MNSKYKWHHNSSPLIWKELLCGGSRPHYIGGASDFLEYCHTYYNLIFFMDTKKMTALCINNKQLQNNSENMNIFKNDKLWNPSENKTICISGANNPLTIHLVSQLLDTQNKLNLSDDNSEKRISKIYLYHDSIDLSTIELIEKECFYIETVYSKNIIKSVSKLGLALTSSDLLIILDHVSFK